MVWEAAASLSSARLSSRRGAFYFSSSPGTWRAGSRGDWNESVDALQTPRGAALPAWGRGDGGRRLMGPLTTSPGWAKPGSQTQGTEPPPLRPPPAPGAPPPLPGWQGLARAPGAHCAGSWHQLGRGISITKSRSESRAARRGLYGAVTRSSAPRAAGSETLGAAGPCSPLPAPPPGSAEVPASKLIQEKTVGVGVSVGDRVSGRVWVALKVRACVQRRARDRGCRRVSVACQGRQQTQGHPPGPFPASPPGPLCLSLPPRGGGGRGRREDSTGSQFGPPGGTPWGASAQAPTPRRDPRVRGRSLGCRAFRMGLRHP